MQKAETWAEIYARLAAADTEQALEAATLNTLAVAAYLTGRDAESHLILEKAHLGHLDSGQITQAARCAFWLGLILMNSGQKARAGGWIMTAQRILEEAGISECAEAGLLLIPQAIGALYGGHPEKALHLFRQAEQTGSAFEDMDLIALSRLGQGQAYISQENVAQGTRLFDELMVTVETERVYPVVAGIIYCAVIETCQKVWDLHRAREWTWALTRWCENHPDIIPFRGQCLVRRAEIIQLYGEWSRAIAETDDACTLLTRPPGEPAAGEAFYRKAELLRLSGDFKKAEDSYGEAAKWGLKPQPGLALLRLAQGQVDAAEISIRNALHETGNVSKRVLLLPAVVRIMTESGKPDEAHAATAELSEIAGRFDTPYLHAMVDHCQGATLLAQEQYQSALGFLQNALVRWSVLRLPYETAQTRELKGVAYQNLRDKDNADAEFAAARWIYEQLEALPDTQRLNQLTQQAVHPTDHQLTLRELQVLRLVADGKTNKEVAGELFISERTVDRHVSNIFNKLGVSSRTEAATFGYKKGLPGFQ